MANSVPLRILIALAFSFATNTAVAAILPPGECTGIIGNGYGEITILADQGDGKIHGTGVFQSDYDKRRGVPTPSSSPFVGQFGSDGSANLYRLDGTLWFDAIRVVNGVFVGRYHSADGKNTAPAQFPCK